MRHALLFALAMAIAPAGGDAQSGVQVTRTVSTTSASDETQPATHTLSPNEVQRLAAQAIRLENRCPVFLSARQLGAPYNREVSGRPFAKDGKQAGQSVHLSVAPRDARAVVSVMVTVHGFSSKSRLEPTLGAEDSGDAERTLYARFASSGGSADAGAASAVLALPGFSAVTSVELRSIVYGDGSTWKLAAGSACSARIDPLMLVDGR